ncbi:MAG: hypothetical protein H6981_07205 [Gammaproteobacteria bacterium]|nr:hypothetical protein [Gammaproteobacteria bacterium]
MTVVDDLAVVMTEAGRVRDALRARYRSWRVQSVAFVRTRSAVRRLDALLARAPSAVVLAGGAGSADDDVLRLLRERAGRASRPDGGRGQVSDGAVAAWWLVMWRGDVADARLVAGLPDEVNGL